MIDPAICRGCDHWKTVGWHGGANDGQRACHYLLDVGTPSRTRLGQLDVCNVRSVGGNIRPRSSMHKALSDAAKVVRTMQERTIPYYRNRAGAAEKEVEWKNKVIEAAERRFVEAEARAEKAERERDAAVSDLTYAVNQYRLFTTDIDLCGLCKFDLPPAGENGQTHECPGFYKDNCFEWRGIKEE